jgi:hypothetical protein
VVQASSARARRSGKRHVCAAGGPAALALIAELRRPAAKPAVSWGTALAAVDLLVIVPGKANVEAVELRRSADGSFGSVTVTAALPLAPVPPAALGGVSLRTSASVQGNGAFAC